MKTLATYLLCLAIVFLPGCGGSLLSPQQQTAAVARAEQLHSDGAITADELAAVRAIVEAGGAGRTLEDALWTVGSIIGSIFGVYVWRGSPNDRRGLAPHPKDFPA